MIDAYDMDGWRGASREKLRPAEEIRKAKIKIFNAKLRVRELFKHIDLAMDGARDLHAITDEDGELDAEDVFCCACGDGESTDDNDILLCDGFCDRGFHQRCCVPPVRTEDIPEGDEGWLCALCDARVDCFYTLNADFELELDAGKATFADVFPEEAEADVKKEGPGQENETLAAKKGDGGVVSGGIMEQEWPSDEEDDEDFGADAASDDGKDDEDEPLSGSGRSESDDSDDDSGGDSARRRLERALRDEPEVVVGKRRRAKVDYRKLNDEMFGDGEAFEGEFDDERRGGWGPASPKSGMVTTGEGKRPKKAPRAKTPSSASKKRRRSSTSAAPTSPRSPKSRRLSNTPAGKQSTKTSRFGDETRASLERTFSSGKTNPGADDCDAIGERVGLTSHQVKIWFMNRRRASKKRASTGGGDE